MFQPRRSREWLTIWKERYGLKRREVTDPMGGAIVRCQRKAACSWLSYWTEVLARPARKFAVWLAFEGFPWAAPLKLTVRVIPFVEGPVLDPDLMGAAPCFSR